MIAQSLIIGISLALIYARVDRWLAYREQLNRRVLECLPRHTEPQHGFGSCPAMRTAIFNHMAIVKHSHRSKSFGSRAA